MRQLKLLALLAELEPVDRDHQVEIEELEKDPTQYGFTSSQLDGDLEAMKNWGWIDFWPTNDGIGSLIMKQPALDAAEEYQALRNNPRRRAQEIRDAVLNWLYDLQFSGHASGISDFLSSSRNDYLGHPYDQEELYRAAKWLMDEEYLSGTRAMGGEVLRPSITTKGTRVIEMEQSVNTALTQAGMTVNEVNISGSQGVNVSVASTNVNQSNTMTQGQIEGVEKIIRSVRALLTPAVIGVSEEVADEAQAVTTELEEHIQSGAPQTGFVKSLLFKLADMVATGTLQGGIDALNGMIHQATATM